MKDDALLRSPMLISRDAMRRAFFVVCAVSVCALSQSNKLPMVAVMPLSSVDVKGSASQVVADALSDELLKTGKVRVMERAQMETILKEQGFAQSGACDGSECAVEVGKLLSIDRMVVGSLGQIGSSWSLSLRAVDVSTGEVLGSSRRQQKGEIDEVTTGIVPVVAQEMVQILNGVKPDSDAWNAGSSTAHPAKAAVDGESKRVLWPWLVGGAVVVGGGAAAVVLISGGSSDAAVSPSPSSNSENQTLRWVQP